MKKYTKRIPWVDTLIQSHVADIVAIDLSTEGGHLQALELVRSLFATFTRPGLVELLERSQNGRLVLGLFEQLEAVSK